MLSWPWQKAKPVAVFRITATDGSKHEVAGTSLFEWLALRTAEGRALPTQDDMRDMLHHLDGPAADKALFALIRAALPGAVYALKQGRDAMELDGDIVVDVDLD
jgi:hypothetical protein